MFRLFISNQFENYSQILNSRSGIFSANYIPRSATGVMKLNRYSYDANHTHNSLGKMVRRNTIALFDIEHIGTRDHTSKSCIKHMVDTYHKHTNYSSQIGLVKYWPTYNLAGIETDLDEHLLSLYTTRKHNEVSFIRDIQFIVAWAHLYTDSMDQWSRLAEQSHSILSALNKPIYGDITISYHESHPSLGGKIINEKQIEWMINRLWQCQYDGVIVRDQFDIVLPNSHMEAITSTMNQLNE